MGWGPSAVYLVEYGKDRKVERLRIANTMFARAEKGLTYPQTRICLMIRQRVIAELGYDPGFIYYKDLVFTKIRQIPPSAKRPPKMKLADSALRKNSHADTLTPRR